LTSPLDTGNGALLIPALAVVVIVFAGAAFVVRRVGRTRSHG
jgi:hypothetical protein